MNETDSNVDPEWEAAFEQMIARGDSGPDPGEEAEVERLLKTPVAASAFDRIRDDPSRWLGWARSNRGAAELLHDAEHRENFEHYEKRLAPPARSYVQQVLMLHGYAIENLLKGIYVRRPPKPIPSGELGELKGLAHDLVGLARACKVSLTSEETQLLRSLTKIVSWQGRYPLGPSAAKTPIVHTMGDGEVLGARDLFDKLMRVFDGL